MRHEETWQDLAPRLAHTGLVVRDRGREGWSPGERRPSRAMAGTPTPHPVANLVTSRPPGTSILLAALHSRKSVVQRFHPEMRPRRLIGCPTARPVLPERKRP